MEMHSRRSLYEFHGIHVLRHIFERVVATCMAAGLVKGEGFAVDASVMEANASRYHGKAPGELDWTDTQRQKRAVAEYLAGLEVKAQRHERRLCQEAALHLAYRWLRAGVASTSTMIACSTAVEKGLEEPSEQ